MEYTSKQLENAYNNANPKIRDILNDSWVSEKTAKIGQEFNLRIDKIDSLVKLVGLVLLNMIPIANFIKVLEEELFVDEEFAHSLSSTIDQEIFEKVRKIVKDEELGREFNDEEFANTRDEIEEVVENSENINIEDMSFKDRLKNTKIQKVEKKQFDPYREVID
jgi:hypothetical protein